MIQSARITWPQQAWPGFGDPALTVLEHSPAPIIGLAGVGRPLAAELVAAMLVESGVKTVSGWSAALERLDSLGPDDRIVVDVGPHMAWTGRGALSILAVIGLASDELEAGEDADDYVAALGAAARGVRGGLIVSADCARSTQLGRQTAAAVCRVSTSGLAPPSAVAWVRAGEVLARDPLLGIERRICRLSDTAFGGPFLTNTLLIAMATALAAGSTIEAARQVAQRHLLVDHAETVAVRRRVRWVADIAATSPGRAASTVLACDTAGRALFVIAGGRHGGQPLSRWAATLRAACEAVLLVDSAAEALSSALLSAAGGAHIIRCADLDDAIGVAERLSGPGDVVLFSPACEPDSLAYPSPGERFRSHFASANPARVAA